MSYAEVVWIFFGFQTILAHLGIVSNMFSTWTCLRCIIIPHDDLGQVHGQRPVEAAAPVRGRRGGLVRHRPKQTPPWTCLQVLLSSFSIIFVHHSFTILLVITIIVCRHFHGNFSCIGMNAAGPSPMSDPIELVVLYPPGQTKTDAKTKTRER